MTHTFCGSPHGPPIPPLRHPCRELFEALEDGEGSLWRDFDCLSTTLSRLKTLPTPVWGRFEAVSGATNRCLGLVEGFSGVFCPREPWTPGCSVTLSISAIWLPGRKSFEGRVVLGDWSFPASLGKAWPSLSVDCNWYPRTRIPGLVLVPIFSSWSNNPTSVPQFIKHSSLCTRTRVYCLWIRRVCLDMSLLSQSSRYWWIMIDFSPKTMVICLNTSVNIHGANDMPKGRVLNWYTLPLWQVLRNFLELLWMGMWK